MEIIKIEPFFLPNKIVVTIKEYPDVKPIFDADLTPEELQTQLKAWKINQDAIDIINNNPVEEPEPVVDSKLKDLEGTQVK